MLAFLRLLATTDRNVFEAHCLNDVSVVHRWLSTFDEGVSLVLSVLLIELDLQALSLLLLPSLCLFPELLFLLLLQALLFCPLRLLLVIEHHSLLELASYLLILLALLLVALESEQPSSQLLASFRILLGIMSELAQLCNLAHTLAQFRDLFIFLQRLLCVSADLSLQL